MPRKKSNNYGTVGEYAKVGFGVTLGSGLAFMIYIFLGMLFFVPGFILLKKEQAKEKKGEKANNGMKILAYVLMFIGFILALGIGFGTFIGEVRGEFE